MLPVCPGWTPTSVALLLKRPVMKFIFVFSGAIGSRLLPSSISAPEPLAHQCLELIPLPMNNAAKRLGKGPEVGSLDGSMPQTGIDSSHGRAIATPTPRRNLRREVCGPMLLIECRSITKYVEERGRLVRVFIV